MNVPTGAATSDAPVRLSVCIPAYNRPAELRQLLESVLAQRYANYEVVICEDHSRQRAEIRSVVDAYRPRFGDRLRYFENDENLGYDRNYRELLRRATGHYCFIMGNDDIVAPGAFDTVVAVVRRSPDVGVILRSLAYFDERPDRFTTIARYAADELRLPPGEDTIVQFYRRCGIMSGLVVRREEAVACATDRFDGLMYYQLHVVAHVLWRRPGVIVPEVLAYYRDGQHKEFGSSAVERGRFRPGEGEDVGEGLRFLEGKLAIAGAFDAEHGTRLRARVVRDLARHSYPTFAHHARQPWRAYLQLYLGLAHLGYWRTPLFHASAVAVAVFGPQRLRRVVRAVRRRLGYTPRLGERPRDAVVLRTPALGARPHEGLPPRLTPSDDPAGASQEGVGRNAPAVALAAR